ncbi:hypothetical protein Hanom_Chr03g00228191 [Helianthus anomalus]
MKLLQIRQRHCFHAEVKRRKLQQNLQSPGDSDANEAGIQVNQTVIVYVQMKIEDQASEVIITEDWF